MVGDASDINEGKHMKFQRLPVLGVVVVVALGLSACGGSSGASPGVAAADPITELTAAADRLKDESMKMKMAMSAGMEAAGAADTANKKFDMTMKMSMSGETMVMAIRLIGADLYMRYEGVSGGKWMHVDAAKIPAGSDLNPENMASADKFISAATGVTRTGDGSYRGSLDMTKTPDADQSALKALGDKAAAVPFTAEVDAQGRLTELVLDMNSLSPLAGKITTTYYDFGSAVTVQKPPASQVVEMPAEMLASITA